MNRANRSITTLNSVMIEYISGMKLIKAYKHGEQVVPEIFRRDPGGNAMWNETFPERDLLTQLLWF